MITSADSDDCDAEFCKSGCDDDPGLESIPGGIIPVVDAKNKPWIIELAELAMHEYNKQEKTNYKFVEVVKANRYQASLILITFLAEECEHPRRGFRTFIQRGSRDILVHVCMPMAENEEPELPRPEVLDPASRVHFKKTPMCYHPVPLTNKDPNDLRCDDCRKFDHDITLPTPPCCALPSNTGPTCTSPERKTGDNDAPTYENPASAKRKIGDNAAPTSENPASAKRECASVIVDKDKAVVPTTISVSCPDKKTFYKFSGRKGPGHGYFSGYQPQSPTYTPPPPLFHAVSMNYKPASPTYKNPAPAKGEYVGVVRGRSGYRP